MNGTELDTKAKHEAVKAEHLGKVKLLLIDDHLDYRWLLRNWLAQNGYSITGCFTHADFVHEVRNDLRADVAIISYDDSVALVMETVSFLRAHYPSAKVLINSIYDEQREVEALTNTVEIQGYLFKIDKDPQQHVLNALAALGAGQTYMMKGKVRNTGP